MEIEEARKLPILDTYWCDNIGDTVNIHEDVKRD